MNEQKDFAGKGGFIWWMGFIEDRYDPLKMGRMRVRCIGWHADNKMQLPTEGLPWAIPMFPINNSNPYPLKEGDMVVGFFTDGEAGQEPIILGTFPGLSLKAGNRQEAFSDGRTEEQLATSPVKPNEQPTLYPRQLDEPSTSRLARNDPSYPSYIVQNKKTNRVSKVEPESYYDTEYPYNNVYESESGHAIEIDDTKDHERLHFYHRSGSYVEFGPNGDRAERIQKNKFTVVIGDDSVYVQGDVKLYVDGNVTAEIGGQANITVSGNINATTPNLNLTGNLNVNGSAIITGDVTAQGTSVHTHTHSGVQSGGGNTGSPN